MIMRSLSVAVIVLFSAASALVAQESPPTPSAPRPVTIPSVVEKKFSNGLTVVVVRRRSVPLVSVQLLTSTGVTFEEMRTAGLVKLAIGLMTKGTRTRTSTMIANEFDFLGANIGTGYGLDSSTVSLNVTSDKIEQAISLFSDVVLRPTFPEKEIKLARAQALDELTFNLGQPGYLSNYVASAYSFYGHPASGTPQSLKDLKRSDVLRYYRESFMPEGSVLIFVGDIDPSKAFALAQKNFGLWKNPPKKKETGGITLTQSAESVAENMRTESSQPLVKRMLVVDIPKSGQAAVAFAKQLPYAGHIFWNDKKNGGEISHAFFPGLVLNSVLGGGYSSRLNLEIRIKRGLSYGASSAMTWRAYDSRFSARAQTKNESAAEVAELIIGELQKLKSDQVPANELVSRKAALIGNFGRDLETNSGMIDAVSELYTDRIDSSELNAFLGRVQAVDAEQVINFARSNMNGGDIIIVGDYSIFKNDLAKRFPGVKVDVIKAEDLDLSKENLHK